MAKLISFFGGDSQTGTTTLSIAAAQSLSLKGKKVLLILASCEIDEGYFEEAKTDIGGLLRLSKITKEDVSSCITGLKNYDLIAGSKDMTVKQFFEPSLIKTVRQAVDRNYDFIIVDAGHDATLALPVSALLEADRRYYVLTGNAKCAARFAAVNQVIIKGLLLDESGDRLILSKAKNSGSDYALADLISSFDMEGFEIPYFEQAGFFEFQKKSAYGEVTAFTRAVDAVAQDIQR